jgi:hypothetical protein
VFAVLADPSRHAAIDGTGWVRDSLDGQRLTGSGQIFRVTMYHDNHPDGSTRWPTGSSRPSGHASFRGSRAMCHRQQAS